jgi:hypothetical protein
VADRAARWRHRLDRERLKKTPFNFTEASLFV